LQITIDISDISGRLISTEKVNNTNRINTNISGAAGIYLVSIQTTKHRAILKVIKE